MPEQNVTKYYL